VGVVSTVAGMLMLYQAYVEQDEVFVIIYWALGIAAAGAGLYLLLRTPERREKPREREEPELPAECPSCGAAVASAGKFCGSCGAPLVAREVDEG